jgi:hypothetical protein
MGEKKSANADRVPERVMTPVLRRKPEVDVSSFPAGPSTGRRLQRFWKNETLKLWRG